MYGEEPNVLIDVPVTKEDVQFKSCELACVHINRYHGYFAIVVVGKKSFSNLAKPQHLQHLLDRVNHGSTISL